MPKRLLRVSKNSADEQGVDERESCWIAIGWPFVERYVFRRYSIRRFAAADDQSAAPGIYPTMVPELAIRYVIGIP